MTYFDNFITWLYFDVQKVGEGEDEDEGDGEGEVESF